MSSSGRPQPSLRSSAEVVIVSLDDKSAMNNETETFPDDVVVVSVGGRDTE